MPDKPRIIPGIVRGGVVYPEGDIVLPEGAHVEIVLPDVPPPAAPPPPHGEPDTASAADQWEREE